MNTIKKPMFPLNPDHISSDGKRGINNKIINLNGIGIIPNDYLKGILTEIASALKNPNTMIEFPLNDEKELVRTDAVSLHFDLHPPCRLFREFNKSFFCHECDYLHASLFRATNEDTFREQFAYNKIKNNYEKIFNERYDEKSSIKVQEIQNNKNNTKKRYYVEYDCPILGYRELLFPIFIENNIVGVMFIGELVLVKNLKIIDKYRDHFFSLKNEYVSKSGIPINEEVFLKIQNADTQFKSDSRNILSDSDYNKFIVNAFKEIDKLIIRLYETLENKRKEFISGKMDYYIRTFREQFNKELPNREYNFKILWEIVEKVLCKLATDFPVKHIIIFSKKTFISEMPENLDMVVNIGKNLILENDIIYDLKKIPESLKKQIITSIDVPELLEGVIGAKCNKEEDFIRVFSMPLLNPCIFVIWIRHDNSLWNRIGQFYKISNLAFNNAMMSFYTILSSIYSSVWAKTAQNRMESVFKVYGHETGQIIPGIDSIRIQYLSNSDKLFKLSNEKIQDINHDLDGLLSQLRFLGERAKQIIAGSTHLEKEEFWAFSELLFKWKNTFRLQAKTKNVIISVIAPYLQDPMRPKVYGDKLLLDQALYNLIQNALKYCYRGTIITIDCTKKNREHIFSIKNYGISIDQETDIFELYKRGKNAEDQGLGIGLFIAKNIAELHEGSVSIKCMKISNHNIPLIKEYIKMELSPEWKAVKDEKLVKILIAEDRRLEKNKLYDQVIAQTDNGKYYKPTSGETLLSINKATYMVIFNIHIPSKEK